MDFKFFEPPFSATFEWISSNMGGILCYIWWNARWPWSTSVSCVEYLSRRHFIGYIVPFPPYIVVLVGVVVQGGLQNVRRVPHPVHFNTSARVGLSVHGALLGPSDAEHRVGTRPSASICPALSIIFVIHFIHIHI